MSAEPTMAHRAAWARLFINTLFPPKLDAYMELRWWREGQQIPDRKWNHILSPPNCTTLLPKIDDAHVFVATAAHKAPGTGKRDNCYAAMAAFIDADIKTKEDAERLVAALQAFPLPPTMVVRSGSGWSVHVYWCLAQPYIFMDAAGKIDEEHELAYQRVQLGLAQHFKTDTSMWDLPQILRLPGTRNVKPHNGPGTVVQLLRCNPERRYLLSDFDAWRANAEDLTRNSSCLSKPRVWSDPTNDDAVDFLEEFGRRGWLLSDQGGGMWFVRCPWSEQHSPGGSVSGSAIWAPEVAGWAAGFRCLHEHCDKRRAAEVYEYFRLMRLAETLREARS